jgi:hypothetical protein
MPEGIGGPSPEEVDSETVQTPEGLVADYNRLVDLHDGLHSTAEAKVYGQELRGASHYDAQKNIGVVDAIVADADAQDAVQKKLGEAKKYAADNEAELTEEAAELMRKETGERPKL